MTATEGSGDIDSSGDMTAEVATGRGRRATVGESCTVQLRLKIHKTKCLTCAYFVFLEGSGEPAASGDIEASGEVETTTSTEATTTPTEATTTATEAPTTSAQTRRRKSLMGKFMIMRQFIDPQWYRPI